MTWLKRLFARLAAFLGYAEQPPMPKTTLPPRGGGDPYGGEVLTVTMANGEKWDLVQPPERDA